MYRTITIDVEEKARLKRQLEAMGEVSPVASNPKFFARLIALGIHQEIGTIHDELIQFTYDAETGERIVPGGLASELIEYHGYTGVKVTQMNHRRLEVRVPGIRLLTHPSFSREVDKSYQGLYFFPEVIMRIAARENSELVVVKPWAMNTIFGGFDPAKPYYEGNLWEFVNIDSIRYARLLEHRQIAFLGTHDLVSHISGLRSANWPAITEKAQQVRVSLQAYFAESQKLVPHALVLPHVIGLLLDDLAQPMNFGAVNRRLALDLLLKEIEFRTVSPRSTKLLLKYPARVKELIEAARSAERPAGDLPGLVKGIVREMELNSIAIS